MLPTRHQLENKRADLLEMKNHFSSMLAEYAGKTLHTEAEQSLVSYLEYSENMFLQKVIYVENLLDMTDGIPELLN